MTARDMILDVMNDVDPAFIKEHMDRANLSGFRKFVRYAAPVAIYAAACIAVLLLLPHIIGKTPEKPPEDPAVIVADTETYASSDTVSETETETETEIVTIHTEVPTETSDDTLPSETDHVTDEPVHITTQTEPAITPADTAPGAPEPEPEPEPIPEPKNMVHVMDKGIPFSYMKYSVSYVPDRVLGSLRSNPVFTDAKSFRSFIEPFRNPDLYPDQHSPIEREFPEDAAYFNETFFKTHNLYVNFISEGSGSISVSIDEVGVNSDGSLKINLNRYKPFIQTCDMQYIVYLVAVEKSVVGSSASVEYSCTTYYESYNYSTGESKYMLAGGLSEKIMSYGVKEIPKIGNTPIIIKTNKDLTSFNGKVSAACGGNTDKYFAEMPLRSVIKDSFDEFGYVYVGIYDSDFVIDSNKFNVALSGSDILDVTITSSETFGMDDTIEKKMYVLRFPKKYIDKIKEVNITETSLSEVYEDFTLFCPSCRTLRNWKDVWVSRANSEYEQTGKMIITMNSEQTRGIFRSVYPDFGEMIEGYFDYIEYEEVTVLNYPDDPELIKDIIDGKTEYKFMISVTLKEKTYSAMEEALELFGCSICSYFIEDLIVLY